MVVTHLYLIGIYTNLIMQYLITASHAIKLTIEIVFFFIESHCSFDKVFNV